MSQKLQPVRGTHDIYFEEAEKFRLIVDTARKVGAAYGFKELHTPIFEFTEVFKRTLGETSDVVNKEMYSFIDKGGDNITLRPEFTAGVARAFISNGLQQHLPLKLFSSGPLFRYERPQKGRQRQFHQINFEWLGEKEWNADVEMIILAYDVLNQLGLGNKIKLNLNSLGDAESRANYRDKLIEYLRDFENELSEDSKIRLKNNPLRILDSKDPQDRKILENAPELLASFNNKSADFFSAVQEGLVGAGIEFILNQKIVRGLDYYSHTVFEFIAESDDLGTQNTVAAGGRYDSLISMMGGPDTAAFGFAMGMERLMLMLDYAPARERPVVIISMVGESQSRAQNLAHLVREKFYAEVLYSNNVGKGLKKASEKYKASHAIIIGLDEVRSDTVLLKDMGSGNQVKVGRAELIKDLIVYIK